MYFSSLAALLVLTFPCFDTKFSNLDQFVVESKKNFVSVKSFIHKHNLDYKNIYNHILIYNIITAAQGNDINSNLKKIIGNLQSIETKLYYVSLILFPQMLLAIGIFIILLLKS